MTEASPEPVPVDAQTKPSKPVVDDPDSDSDHQLAGPSPEAFSSAQKGKATELPGYDGKERAAPADVAGQKAEEQPEHQHTEDDDGDEDEEDGEEDDDDEDEDDDDDDEDDEDEEPRLKYARLTQHLAPVYRNGDATSAFLVAGDKMVRAAPSETRRKLTSTLYR